MSEHSAEFVVVPALARILASTYKRVTPLYVWLSREGSGWAGDLETPLRVVVLFARRPKVEWPGQSSIRMKINSELHRDASYWKSRGIPAFAGVPLVSSLATLDFRSRCAWFSIGSRDDGLETIVSLSLGGAADHSVPVPGIRGPLTDRELIEMVCREATETTWGKTVFAIREHRRSIAQLQTPFFSPGYKPVFLLLGQ
jgi:hypothetical protein